MVSSPEIEVETWTPKEEIKKKKGNSFLSPPTAPINFTKNFHQTPACKNKEKYTERAKPHKTKKWVLAKIKENHNREKPKKMKETAKQNKEGDQGSPSAKKNIKCQGNKH